MSIMLIILSIIFLPISIFVVYKNKSNNKFYMFMFIFYFILASIGLYFKKGGTSIYINYIIAIYFLWVYFKKSKYKN